MIGAGELAGASQLRVIECCVVDPPLPVRGTTTKGFSALLCIVRLPVAAPAEEGSNWTANVDDWPGGRVPCTGDIEKPAPVTTAVPVIGELPVFVKVTDKVEVLFSATLPKDKLEGVTDKVAAAIAGGYKFKTKICGELIPA
jgi:hypothetical protein